MDLKNIIANLADTMGSISSSESSDSSNDGRKRRKISKVVDFVEKVIPVYDDKTFQSHFRITRKTAKDLIDRLNGSGVIPVHNFGIENITCEKSLLMTVWYLSNSETFRQISDRFGISISSAHRVLIRVLHFIITLRTEFINWPCDDLKSIYASKFKGMLNNVVGAIDGCHIQIKKPVEQGDNYINRKGYASIIIQAVCDSNKCFTDIYCGEPGSLHDARVFRRSNLYMAGQDPNYFGKYCLLGDSAYPALPWLVTPNRDNGALTAEQKQFNFNHAQQRIVIEHAFGLLKSRFRRLLFINNNDIKTCVKIIMASCVLHNICIIQKDETDINIINIQEDLEM